MGPREVGLLEGDHCTWGAEVIPLSPQCGLRPARPAPSPRSPCAAPHEGPVPLCVPPEKPSVFSRELTDATVTEGEDLSLVCETTALDSPVRWTKDGKALRPSARCQLSQEGHQAQLVITGATLQDGGRYRCESGGSWSSSIVRVHGKSPGSHPCLRVGGPSVHLQGSAALLESPLFCPLIRCVVPALFLCLVFCVPLLLTWRVSTYLSTGHVTNTSHWALSSRH